MNWPHSIKGFAFIRSTITNTISRASAGIAEIWPHVYQVNLSKFLADLNLRGYEIIGASALSKQFSKPIINTAELNSNSSPKAIILGFEICKNFRCLIV